MSRLRRKVTRHKVNEPTIDRALSDLYNEIDKLQATTPSSVASPQEDQPGDVAIIETADGTTTIGVNTENGWVADVNAVFTPIANKSFITSLGTRGMSGRPLPNESVRYDKDSKLTIRGKDRSKVTLDSTSSRLNIGTGSILLGEDHNGTGDKAPVLLKQEDGILKVRTKDDTASADIQCLHIRDTNGKKLMGVDAGGSPTKHIQMTNAPTGGGFDEQPKIKAISSGTDITEENVSLNLESTGTGDINLNIPSDGGLFGVAKNSALTFTVDPHNPRVILRDEALRYSSWTMNDDVMEIGNFDVNNDRTNTHIKISAADDLYLAAGANDIRLSAGGTGQNGATFDLGTEFAVFNPTGSTITHAFTDAGTGLTLDANWSSSTGGHIARGIYIDMDKQNATDTLSMYRGLDIDITDTQSNSGAAYHYGIYSVLTQNTSGTATSTGIFNQVTGADTQWGLYQVIDDGQVDIRMISSADVSEYGDISVGNNGVMTLTTASDSNDGAILLAPDGDVNITTTFDYMNITNTFPIIDMSTAGTTNYSYEVMKIDFDHTGIVASGHTVNATGLNLDMNCESVTHVGTMNQVGIDIDMVAGTDGTQSNTGIHIDVDGADTNIGMEINTAGTHLKLVANADTDDYATMAVADTGDLTIATAGDGSLDSDIILDADGGIELNADANTGTVFKDHTLTVATIQGGLTSVFKLHNILNSSDYFKISQAGSCTIATVDADATANHLLIKPNGQLRIEPDDGGMYFLQKTGAGTDVANYGQLWVKDDDPPSLHYTNENGDDIQITNNGKLAEKWHFHNSARWYTRYDNWYFPSITYGVSTTNWSSSLSSSTLPSTWNDAYNPCIVVPEDCTITSYHVYGNFTSSQTYELALLTGTPTYGSAGNTSLSQIGATQSLAATASIYNKMEQTGLSVNVSAGDIIIPCLRRTTTDTSSYYMFEFAMNIVGILR